MFKPRFITAIGTPLNSDESLHDQGLALHLEDQWSAGIDAILIGGTMGMMQLLSDGAYEQLVRRGIELSAGRGELFVGAGDASFARTKARLEFVNQFDVDGSVVLSPYLMPFNDDELVDYFHALADISRAPLFLYDLPGLTGIDLNPDAIERIFEHANIAGIKSSGANEQKPELIRDTIGNSKRILVAQPQAMDHFLRLGFAEQLDGAYCMAPRCVVAIGHCAAADDWDGASQHQTKITAMLQTLRGGGAVMPAFTAIMNARGLPGRYHPRPYRDLTAQQRDELLNHPTIASLIEEEVSYDVHERS